MSFPCPVPGCDRFASEWSVCRRCAGRLERDLCSIPALAAQVVLTLARQSAQGARYGPRGAEVPLAFDPRASDALGALRAILVGWVRVLIEDGARPWPHDSEAGCATWLLARVPLLRVHPAGGDVCSEIAGVTATCWRVIDRAPDHWFAGPCQGCGRLLYAEIGASAIQCLGCGSCYDVAQRRGWLLDAAREEELSIPDLIRVLPVWLGVALNDSTMRSWHRRGRIAPRGVTLSGRGTYRIGDVLDLLEREFGAEAG